MQAGLKTKSRTQNQEYLPRHASKPQTGPPREGNQRLLSCHASCQRAPCRSGGILGRPIWIVPTGSDQPANRRIRMRHGHWARGHVLVDARVRSGHPTSARDQGMYTVPKPCRDMRPSWQNGHLSISGGRCKTRWHTSPVKMISRIPVQVVS